MIKKEREVSSWFDSPYYHLLYKNRDGREAKAFLNNLVQFLSPQKDAQFLDVGCGKGRHAITLNQMGFPVTGIDISPSNIQEAKKYENDTLHFFLHDKRHIFKPSAFDFVLNLFTSFGFFNTHIAHQKTVSAMAENLKKGGKLILDFLNPYVVINQLVNTETKKVDSITFNIRRVFDGDFIIKEISFEDGGQSYCYYEKVKAIRYKDFERYFQKANLKIQTVFGNYPLHPYRKESSERLIFVTSK